MYRTFYVLFPILLLMLAVSSCTSCGGGERKAGEENPMVAQLDHTPDSAQHVVLNRVTQDSIYVYSHTSRQNEVYSYKEAVASGKVHGELKEGNEYSLFPDTQQRTIDLIINVTQLHGRWIYDEAEFCGIEFNKLGGMSSINTGDICFREWKLLNGQLYIYYVDVQTVADDRHKYEVEEAHIMHFDPKKLVLLFRGKTYECNRH